MPLSACVCCSELVLKRRLSIKWALSLFPLVFVLVIAWLKWTHADWYWEWMCKEDSLVENLTAGFYFVSALIASGIAVDHHRNRMTFCACMYFILAAGLLFIAVEEISWGQRMLGVKTPSVLSRYSYQNEINLHNTKWFPLHLSYIVVGLYGGLSRLLVPEPLKQKYGRIIDCFVPGYSIAPYFLVVAVLYLYYDYFSSWLVALFGAHFGWSKGNFMIPGDQEPAEFLLSVGFFLFVLINRCRQTWLRQQGPG